MGPGGEQGLFLGIDLGTSGCRGCAIDREGRPRAWARTVWTPPEPRDGRYEQDPEYWWQGVVATVAEIHGQLQAPVEAISVDGTSGTLVVTDDAGRPLIPAVLYSDRRAATQAQRIAEVAPATSGAHGASSSLAKLLWLQDHERLVPAARVLSQADWIAGRMCGRFDISDENNSLKLGYDPIERRWPTWIARLGVPERRLPRVQPPGSRLGTIARDQAAVLGLPTDAMVVSGTTDSIAAFIATGAGEPGDAVTSLGSTLAVKVVSERPVSAPDYGVYSHRLGERWLAGGASNSGGAILLQHFSDEAIDAMTPQLEPDAPTGLHYYPLPGPGERFPVAEPGMAPRMEPRPEDPLTFFQALLEGIAAVERLAYERLADLGCPYPRVVYSVGGGATNPAFNEIRRQRLNTSVRVPEHTEAAYGSALLAMQGARRAWGGADDL